MRKEAGSYLTIKKMTPAPRDGICRWLTPHRICGVRCGVDSCPPGCLRVPALTAPAVVATANRLGATTAQVALAWLLQRSPNLLLIPGTSSLTHLRENLAAADLGL